MTSTRPYHLHKEHRKWLLRIRRSYSFWDEYHYIGQHVKDIVNKVLYDECYSDDDRAELNALRKSYIHWLDYGQLSLREIRDYIVEFKPDLGQYIATDMKWGTQLGPFWTMDEAEEEIEKEYKEYER